MKDRHIDFTTFTNSASGARRKDCVDEGLFGGGYYRHSRREYTAEEIDAIISHGTHSEQRDLSRSYFNRNGLYKKTLLYYASLLLYSYLLIPNPTKGKQLSTPHINKKYFEAIAYLDKVHLNEIFTDMSLRALIDGSYYGVIQTLDKENLVIFDLPSGYCRSRFKDLYGNDLVEFNVEYFDNLSVITSDLVETLNAYPKTISSHYKKWKKGKVSNPWVRLDPEVGIFFAFSEDARPLFLSMIPATIQYDEAVDIEQERVLEEIRKILVQKVPHLADGQLLFEPDEAKVMHDGAVNMLKSNPNIAVLTTYTDADVVTSRTTSDNVSNSLQRMLENVYAEAGVSPQIFAPTGAQALSTSIKNDISVMMILANKYARFMSYVVNSLFANSNIDFKFIFLPVSLYNQSEYITDLFKLAQSGFSFLQVAAAAGINQYSLTNVKTLENDVLKLRDVLIPLASSYTESSNDAGAPAKAPEDKAPATIQKEDAL